MTIDKQKLKALAEAMPELDWDSQFEDHEQTGFCTVYGKPFEIDGQEHEGPIYVERCTAGQAEFIARAREAVMALLAEIEQLEQYAELEAKGSDAAAQDLIRLVRENRQLKAENETLRKGLKGDFDLDAWLAFVEESPGLRKDAERYRFVSKLAWYVDRAAQVYDLCNVNSNWHTERGSPDEDEVEEAVDAAMAKEAK